MSSAQYSINIREKFQNPNDRFQAETESFIRKTTPNKSYKKTINSNQISKSPFVVSTKSQIMNDSQINRSPLSKLNKSTSKKSPKSITIHEQLYL